MRRALDSLLSVRTMFWLAFVWGFAYISYAIWAKEAFGHYMMALGGSLLVQIPFALFIIMAAYHFMAAFFRRWGVSRVWAVAWAVLPVGVLLYMVGFFMSATMRDQVAGFFGKGEMVRPPWHVGQMVIEDFNSALGSEYLDGLEGEGAVFKFEPKMIISSGSAKHEVGVFPPTRIEGTYFHILDFGYAPLVTVSDQGRELVGGYVVQRLLPPGGVDTFNLQGLPYTFELGMAPVRTITKGSAEARVYDMAKPRYSVRIYKGEDMVFEGLSDGPMAFDNGLVLDIKGYDHWVWLEAARNPGMQAMIAGIWAVLAGIPISTALGLIGLAGAARRIGASE